MKVGRISHVCDCGAKRTISIVEMGRRNGTRCRNCGRNMEPTPEGWRKISLHNSVVMGHELPPEEKKVKKSRELDWNEIAAAAAGG